MEVLFYLLYVPFISIKINSYVDIFVLQLLFKKTQMGQYSIVLVEYVGFVGLTN